MDLTKRTLQISRNGTKLFSDFTRSKGTSTALPMKLDKLLPKGILGFILYCQDSPAAPMSIPPNTPPFLQEVMHNYADVFTDIKGLPPNRQCDHSIPLKQDAEPPNIMPYRIPHNKNTTLEQLIKEMLDMNMIRPNTSPYSSPVLLGLS